MKDYSKKLEDKKKLIKFMNNSENKILTVCFFTVISYLILTLITKNKYVLLFGYFVLYFIYSKLYVYLYKKLVDSFTVENNEPDSFSQPSK